MNPEQRLAEIRTEAEELGKGEVTRETVERLRELKAEREQLLLQIEANGLTGEVTAEVNPPAADAEAEGDNAEANTGDADNGGTAEAAGNEDSDTDAARSTGAQNDENAGGTEDNTGDPDAGGISSEDTANVANAVAAASIADEATTTSRRTFRPRLVASSNMEGLSVGASMTVDQVKRMANIAAAGNYDGRHVFAGIRRWAPDVKAVSSRNSAIENTRIMATAGEKPMPLAAAACFCGPNEAVKTIAQSGEEGRPVASLFRSNPVSGRFNYVKPLPLGDVGAGISIWDCDDQNGVDPTDPETWKACVDLDCQEDVTVEPYLLPACGTVTTHQQLSHPELVDDFLRKLAIAYDRNAERQLLDLIRAESHVIGFSEQAGILSNLTYALAQYSDVIPYGNRLNLEGYTLLVPLGTIEKIVADQHLRGAQQGLRRDAILAMLSDLGVRNIVEIHEPDSTATAPYAAATAALPNLGGAATPFDPTDVVETVPFYLLQPDAFRHGSSEIVEAGFIRDAQLAKQNRTQWFYEGAEYLEKINVQPSFVFEIAACPNGQATAMADGPACGPVGVVEGGGEG